MSRPDQCQALVENQSQWRGRGEKKQCDATATHALGEHRFCWLHWMSVQNPYRSRPQPTIHHRGNKPNGSANVGGR